MSLKTFDNGLRLVMRPIPGMYSVSVGVWVGAGSSDETEENNGISHFIEHMLFKGTGRRTSFDITDCIDRIGAQINAFTSKECTCYYTKSTAEHVETSFDILSDMLFHSLFSEEEMAREKGVILEEISMTEDTPDDLCIDLLQKAYFQNHPLGKTIIGTPENVKRFTKADVERYLAEQYTPDNIVVAVAGNIDEARVADLAEKYFANGFRTGKAAPRKRAELYRASRAFEGKGKDVEQSHIAIAFPSVSFASPGVEAALVACNIFGGGMSSRLFQTVREQKGLAYSVYAYLSTYKNNGMLTIYAGVNPKNTELAVTTIREEIEKLVHSGVTEDEFRRGKEQLKGTFILSQESTSSVMNSIGKYMVVGGRLFNMEEKLAAIEAVTPEALNAALKGYFDWNAVCASYVGPKDAERNIVEILTKA